MLISVYGPGYNGWRPPTGSISAAHQVDGSNPYAPQIYDAGTTGHVHSSAMVVDVQVQDTSLGFEGELAWKTVTKETRLILNVSDTSTTVEWGGINGPELPQGIVALPYQITSSTKMRLRINEVDFYGGTDFPHGVNTALRRPFVAFIPLN